MYHFWFRLVPLHFDWFKLDIVS